VRLCSLPRLLLPYLSLSSSLLTFLSPLFFFTAPPTPELYTLSLHDALPISRGPIPSRHALLPPALLDRPARVLGGPGWPEGAGADRKSTRLNSSHVSISYAVFCLKKKKTN